MEKENKKTKKRMKNKWGRKRKNSI